MPPKCRPGKDTQAGESSRGHKRVPDDAVTALNLTDRKGAAGLAAASNAVAASRAQRAYVDIPIKRRRVGDDPTPSPNIPVFRPGEPSVSGASDSAGFAQLSTPATSPAPSTTQPAPIKQESVVPARTVADSTLEQAVTVKEEPTEPSVPVVSAAPTKCGTYRVKVLPPNGANRMAWAQAQFNAFKTLAKLPIRLASKPKLLPDGLVIDWVSDVPVIIGTDLIPRLPPPASEVSPSSPSCSTSQEPRFPLNDDAPPTPQSLPPPPQRRSPSTSLSSHPLPPVSTPAATPSSSSSEPPVHPPSPTRPAAIPSSSSSEPPVHPSSPTRSDDAASVASSSQTSNPARDAASTLSLFARHKQALAERRRSSAVGSALPSQNEPARVPSPAPSSASVGAARRSDAEEVGEVEPAALEVDSDDDLYMSHDEYDRLSRSVEPQWDGARCAQLEQDAVQWLKEYIRTFDSDRARLASAYSQLATFSVRTLPPAGAAPPQLHAGPLAIAAALLDLPDAFAFNLVDGGATLHFDLVVTFDVVVCGARGEPTPLVMLVCYADPAHGPGGGAWRWVCDMRFVLRPKGWDERDRSAEGLYGLVALSHQMTLRKIPSDMPWHWSSQTLG